MNVSYEDLQLLDEPPGKLRAVRFLCRDVEPPRQVVLEIEYAPGSFSTARSWAQELVRKLKVVKVHESTDQLH